MAATFQNLGFEIAGDAPGLAASWVLTFRAAAEQIAGYGAPEQPQEGFERSWSGNEAFVSAFTPAMLAPALYDGDEPESVEDFDEGWSENEAFLRELVSVEAADYDPGPGAKLVEDFNSSWFGNEGFLFVFSAADLAAAPLEIFERNWRGNETFVFAFGAGDLEVGPMETFEIGWRPMTTV